MPNARLAAILVRSGRIDGRPQPRLRDVIALRNAITHGADPVVSEQMVEAAGEVLQARTTALAKRPALRRERR